MMAQGYTTIEHGIIIRDFNGLLRKIRLSLGVGVLISMSMLEMVH